MIKVKIKNNEVEVKDLLSYERNIKEERDFANISIFSNRKIRYETYDRVDIEVDDIDEQYLVQSDLVITHRTDLYEHELTLIENIAMFDTQYPADRPFRKIGQTLGDILKVYQRELSHYNNFDFEYEEGPYLNTLIPQKEFIGVNFSVIVTDLFRIIDAVPKLKYENDTWVLYPLFYTFKNELVDNIPFSETQSINSLDYATKLKSQIKNGIYENVEPTWYPSEDGYILPRSSSLLITDSNLQYEVDSPIIGIEKVEAVDVNFSGPMGADKIETVDITSQIVTREEFGTLNSIRDFEVFFDQLHRTNNAWNNIIYNIGSRVIGDLFIPNGASFLGFNQDTESLKNAIERAHWLETFAPDPIKWAVEDSTRDIKIRIKYLKQRNLDITHHRQYVDVMNEATVVHNQRDSAVEISRYKKNLKNLSNRMGNVKITGSRIFDFGERVYQLGDYTEDNLLFTRIKNTVYNENYILCQYELSENFANVDGESSISRDVFPFTINQKVATTNLIDENYLVISEQKKGFGGRLEFETYQNLIKIFGTNPTGLSKIEVGIFRPILPAFQFEPTEVIHMPVLSGGDGNMLSFHVYFPDLRNAGVRIFEDDNIQRFIPYTDPDGRLEDFKMYFTEEKDIEDDGAYPVITDEDPYLEDALTVTDRIEPVDLDSGANFAFTYIVHFVTDNKKIIIGEALSKRNYLIEDPPENHTFEIYKSEKPYNIYDQVPRNYDEIASMTFTFNLGDGSITFTSAEVVEHFALVKNGEILIAVNRKMLPGASYKLFLNLVNNAKDEFGSQLLDNPVISHNAPYYDEQQTLVIFDTQGGLPRPDNIVVEPGAFIDEPTEIPFKEGYVFKEWDVTFPYQVNELQVIITAQYIEVQTLPGPVIKTNAPYYADAPAIVIFDAFGGLPKPPDYLGLVGDTITEPGTDPSKEGFIFVQWDVEFPYTITNPVTYIYAIFAEIRDLLTPVITTNAPYYVDINIPEIFYELEFLLDGGTADFNVLPYLQILSGTVVQYPGGASKDNHIFLGYDTPFPLTVNSNETVTAEFQEIQTLETPDIDTNAPYYLEVNEFVTVTFVDWDGEVLDEQLVIISGDATAPEDPTREGYTFSGWDNDFTGLVDDVTVTAQYDRIFFTVNWYNYNNSVLLKTEQVAYGESASPPSAPSRTGYNFVGWNVGFSDFNEVYQNYNIKALYSLITYSIQYVMNGGTNSGNNPSTYNVEQLPITLSNPSRTNHCFTGWSPSNNIPSGSTGTKTFYASWTELTFLTAPFRDTSISPSATWDTTRGSARIDAYSKHNNPFTVNIQMKLYESYNGQWYYVQGRTKTNVSQGARSQHEFTYLMESTTYSFGYRATKSGCYNPAEETYHNYTITTPAQPTTSTPSTATSQYDAKNVAFTITNNDDLDGYAEWEIREGSTTGTLKASGNYYIDNKFNSNGRTITVEATNLEPSTTYWLTNVFVTATSKKKSNQGANRSRTTSSLPPTATPTFPAGDKTSTETAVSFKIKNEDSDNVTARYDINRAPDSSSPSVFISGSSLSSTRTFSGLNDGQTYTIYANALSTTGDKQRSSNRTTTITTIAIPDVWDVRAKIDTQDGVSNTISADYSFSDGVSDDPLLFTFGYSTIRSDVTDGLTLTITVPDSFSNGSTSYLFGAWSVNGVNQGNGVRTITININEDKDLIANYAAFGL